MKPLAELFAEFEGKTTIQKIEHYKKLLGIEVRVSGTIRNIDTQHINLYGTNDNDISWWPYGALIFISHESSQLGNQLLEYSAGDKVELATRLKEASFSEFSAHYRLDLFAILKRVPREEILKAQREAKQKEEQKNKDACFVASAAYGAQDPSVVLLRAYRDRILSKTFAGRIAIRLYYAVSPPFARFIQASSYRRSKVRALLNPVLILARRALYCHSQSDA